MEKNTKFFLNFLKLLPEDTRIEYIKALESDLLKIEMINTLSSEDKRVSCLVFLKDEDMKVEVIQTLSEDKRIKSLNLLKYQYDRVRIIQKLSEENIIKCLDNLDYYKLDLSDNSKAKIIMNLSELYKVKFLRLLKFKDKHSKAKILNSLENVSNIKLYIQNTQDFETLQIYRKELDFNNVEIIKNNLEKFLEIEGVKDIDRKKDILLKLYKVNNLILKTIDFSLINDKYISLLGLEKINQISCYANIQNKILQLNAMEISLLSKCLNYIEKAKKQLNVWTIFTDRFLTNIKEYGELINKIKNDNNFIEENISVLVKLFQNENIFNITSPEQVADYNSTMKKVCDEKIKSKNIIHKKQAVLYKIFGQDVNYTKELIEKYGEDIETIEDQNLKDYMNSLIMILEADESSLEKIYKECSDTPLYVDKTLIENSLRQAYLNLYNEGLYKVKKDVKPGEIIEAGTNFKMLVTSIGAFTIEDEEEVEEKKIKNYKENWNRPSISSQHFCTSYIRNDLIKTAPIYEVCYGFNKMQDNSLIFLSTDDIFSHLKTFTPKAEENEKYYSPDNLINNTTDYNELDFYRFQNGERKQPDYIVCFREYGKINYLEKAKKASKDFGGLPIVMVDIDKCLENERQRVLKLKQEYDEKPNEELLKKIYKTIRNNRVTRPDFCSEMIDEIEKLFEKNITKKDLECNYKETTVQERQQMSSMIKNIYKRLTNLTKENNENFNIQK